MRKILVEITIADDSSVIARALPPPPPPPPLPPPPVARRKKPSHAGIPHATHRAPEATVLRFCETRLCGREFFVIPQQKTNQRFCQRCAHTRKLQFARARQERFRARCGGKK